MSRADILALADRAESGEGSDPGLSAEVLNAILGVNGNPALLPHDLDVIGSIDAVTALIREVLPGWAWTVFGEDALNDVSPGACLAAPDTTGGPAPWTIEREVFEGKAKDPARALLAATLRAYAAREVGDA